MRRLTAQLSAFLRDWERPSVSVWISIIIIRESALFTFSCICHLAARFSTCESASTEALYFLLLPFTSVGTSSVQYIPKFPIYPNLGQSCLCWGMDRRKRKDSFCIRSPSPLSHRTQCWRKTLYLWLFSFCGAGTAAPGPYTPGLFPLHTGTGAGSYRSVQRWGIAWLI